MRFTLQTYRPKDRERTLLLLDEAQVDMAYLENILERHGLQGKWRRFRRRYDEECGDLSKIKVTLATAGLLLVLLFLVLLRRLDRYIRQIISSLKEDTDA